MKVAVLFAGQGAQHPGMTDGIENYPHALQLFSEAQQLTAMPLLQLCKQGPAEELNQTILAQPALYTQGYALYHELRTLLPQLLPSYCAGLSLGEFTAHAAAGSYTFSEGLRIVVERARAMQHACTLHQGGMISLLGATPQQAAHISQELDIDIANYNCPGQIVLSGPVEKLAAIPDLAKAAGIKRTIPLNVSGAFHSRLMQPAADRLRNVLESTPWKKPLCPIVANVTASPCDEPNLFAQLLTQQVTNSVRWDDSIRFLRDAGIRVFLGIGPGEVLAGLNKRIDPTLRTITLPDFTALEQVAQELRKLFT